jgi:hypothetical protein
MDRLSVGPASPPTGDEQRVAPSPSRTSTTEVPRPRPHWVASLVSLAIVLAVVALLLRLLHVGLPLLYPRVLQGPFSLTDVREVEQYTGESPLVPVFHPQELGSRPVYVTVYRRPVSRVLVFWQGDRFLALDQWRGGEPPAVPPIAQAMPIAEGGRWWRQGRTWHVVLRREGSWVEMTSDLDQDAVRRVAGTLRPYRELR